MRVALIYSEYWRPDKGAMLSSRPLIRANVNKKLSHILQGSVATRLQCEVIFNDNFINKIYCQAHVMT